MSTEERIKRPEPERTQPIRSWSTLFGAPEPGGKSLQDVVSRSVDLGYRVVDEYVRQGQRAAQRLGERSYRPENMVSDVQELTARLAQYASEFLGVWFELLELAASGSAARRMAAANGAPAGPAPPPAAPAREPSRPPRVRIEVASAQPAEVELDLRPEAAGAALVVHALRCANPATPRMTDVTLDLRSPDDPLTLRIRVPGDQPPGVYTGVILDERTSLTVGTVSVRITPGP